MKEFLKQLGSLRGLPAAIILLTGRAALLMHKPDRQRVKEDFHRRVVRF